jgi:Putative Ig domain
LQVYLPVPDRNSGLISGTITGNRGSYTAKVTVSDTSSAAGSVTFTWTVKQ